MDQKDQEKIFDDWFRYQKRGKRYSYDPVKNRGMTEEQFNDIQNFHKQPYTHLIQSTINHPEALRRNPIYFDFVDNPNFNACATITPNGDELIGVYAGTGILLSLFLRMLSHADSFTFIGDPSKEIRDIPPIRTLYNNFQDLIDFGDINNEPYRNYRPKNSVRYGYAFYLYELAMNFLVAHELTHLIHGHVHFSNSDFGINMVPELGFGKSQIIPNQVAQVLEWDADRRAMEICVASKFKYINNPNNISMYKQPSESADDAILNLCISVYLLSRICGLWEKNDMNPSSHPPSIIRFGLLLDSITDMICTNYPNVLRQSLSEIYEKARFEGENAVHRLLGRVPDIDVNYIFKSLKEYESYNDMIPSTWRRIKPKLEPFSRFELRTI